MTIATAGPSARSDGGPDTGGSGNIPHAANVFYAVDSSLRLIFLSKPSSLHGRHIGERAAVAVTVTEPYDDWTAIQGVQLWGEARRVKARLVWRHWRCIWPASPLWTTSSSAPG
jgi:hypothetical protein